MSYLLSHINFARRNGWLTYYQEAAAYYGIPVEILLAKDSRETWLGSLPGLQANNWIGSDGVSKGISQINMNAWDFAKQTDPNDVKSYVAMGAQILKEELNRFGNMKAALAAYNAGAGNVRRAIAAGKDPDSVTTKGDYASDVLARAREIKKILADPEGYQASAVRKGAMINILALAAIGTAAYYGGKKYGYI